MSSKEIVKDIKYSTGTMTFKVVDNAKLGTSVVTISFPNVTKDDRYIFNLALGKYVYNNASYGTISQANLITSVMIGTHGIRLTLKKTKIIHDIVKFMTTLRKSLPTRMIKHTDHAKVVVTGDCKSLIATLSTSPDKITKTLNKIPKIDSTKVNESNVTLRQPIVFKLDDANSVVNVILAISGHDPGFTFHQYCSDRMYHSTMFSYNQSNKTLEVIPGSDEQVNLIGYIGYDNTTLKALTNTYSQQCGSIGSGVLSNKDKSTSTLLKINALTESILSLYNIDLKFNKIEDITGKLPPETVQTLKSLRPSKR